jgi:hypothetical protein
VVFLIASLSIDYSYAASAEVEYKPATPRSCVSNIHRIFFSKDGRTNYAALATICVVGFGVGWYYYTTREEKEPVAKTSFKEPVTNQFFVRDIYAHGFVVHANPYCTVGEFKEAIKSSLIKTFPTKDWTSVAIGVLNWCTSLDDDTKKITEYDVRPGSMNLIISLYGPRKAYVYDVKKCVPDLPKTKETI